MARPFALVDVFGSGDFSGNPLAVVAAAEGLDTETMQRITRWLNLSETAFLLPPTAPEADYRVRIFTLARELPFAGHPTLGTAHAWAAAGGQPKIPGRIVQECGAGLVTVRQTPEGYAFAAPPLIRGGAPSAEEIAQAVAVLRLDPASVVDAAWVDNGPGWLGLMLGSAEAVLAVRPDVAPGRPVDIGLIGAHPPGSAVAWEIRALFSNAEGTVIEDPVTGSLNASMAQWLFASGRAVEGYVAAQGTALGRQGRVRIDRDAEGRVWVGGATRTLFAGEGRF